MSDWNLLSTESAARQLGVSVDAVRRYYHSGILAGRRQGRLVLVEQRAVLALRKVIEMARTGTKPTPPAREPGPVDQADDNLLFAEYENEQSETRPVDPGSAVNGDAEEHTQRERAVGEPVPHAG